MDCAVEVHELVGEEKLKENCSREEAVAGDVVLDDAEGDSSTKDMSRGLLAIVL